MIGVVTAGLYHLDEVVTVTATADPGYSFGAWTGDCSGTNPCTLPMNCWQSVTATFVQDEYALMMMRRPGGSTSVPYTALFRSDEVVTVTATADPGYSFGAWTGDCSGTNPCTLTMDGSKSVSATFVQDEYALTITQATGGTISALPAGPYHLDEVVTVTATADPGYSFGASSAAPRA